MTSVQFQTAVGNINLNLFDSDAPVTVASFLHLIKKGYYDGLIFHRVISDFMIQGGCPLGTGTGSPKAVGVKSFEYNGAEVSYPFKDEFNNGHTFNKGGILAMANAGPRTNGSQFFITHGQTPHLNNKHTIFGEIVGADDMDIVNKVENGTKINKVVLL